MEKDKEWQEIEADETLMNEENSEIAGDTDGENSTEHPEEWKATLRAAALLGKASFSDQIDYYDPDSDELV